MPDVAWVKFSKRHSLWPVVLSCGHFALVTDATYYGRWALCNACVPRTDDPVQKAERLRTAGRGVMRKLRLLAA